MKFFSILFFLISVSCFSQSDTINKNVNSLKKSDNRQQTIINDSISKKSDSIVFAKDSTLTDSLKTISEQSNSTLTKDTSTYQLLLDYPILNKEKPTLMLTAFRNIDSRDYVFYLLIGIISLLAIIKIIFPKYFNNIFNIFFQTSFRQVQTREQLNQDNVAALLLNILFVFSTATFIALTAYKLKIINISFWKIYLVAIIALTIIYITKLLFTQFIGLIFNKKEEALSYSFIVFIVNKIIGILLIPFLFLIAYSTNYFKQLSITASLIIVAILFTYRFISTYKNMSSRLKINAIHFFLYFCSVEILPLLLMYKALNSYIGNGI